MTGLEPAASAEPGELAEHSQKPLAVQGAVISSRRWRHAYGEMLIETCDDGSVWIDGKPVPKTLTLQVNGGTL